MSKTIYLTTPLYYVNASPHIGHSYTEVAADALARYYRLKGEPVFLLTGTDEHGQKIAQAAAAAGQEPQAFVDRVVGTFQSLWKTLDIRYDRFIRTTEPAHITAVQELLAQLYDGKKLTRAEYQGWYCTPDETFWTEGELATAGAPSRAGTSSPPHAERGAPGSVAGAPLCPSCQRPLESAKEEGWYLRLRAHEDWLKQFVRQHPQFVRPETRYNELKSLLEQPLPEYLCITRPKSRVSWGIPVPFSADHVVYVWFDALLNYLTVPRYLERQRKDLWPPDVHFIGKDILRHHALYWPIMLHELGVPDEQMPKTIFAHGWWKIGEQKMSKSLGNIVDPTAVVGGLLKDQPYAADVYRYFLLREIPFGQDGSFSEEAILKRLNTDLGNDLGNLVNRTLSMLDRYLQGAVPVVPKDQLDILGDQIVGGAGAEGRRGLADAAESLTETVQRAMDHLEFSVALEAIMGVASRANQYIELSAPWKLAKQPGNERQLKQVLGVLAEVLRIVSIHMEPFMPSVARAIWQQLGLHGEPARLSDARWSTTVENRSIAKDHPVLFPRMETVG